MNEEKMYPVSAAFLVNKADNVVTMLADTESGTSVKVLGDVSLDSDKQLLILQKISAGHKSALFDIKKDDAIIKYGVVIGKATKDIKKGEWVHLHCMKSVYDERSSHLDVNTGAPKDIRYE